MFDTKLIGYTIGLFLLMFVAVSVADTDFEKMINEAVAAQKKANDVGGEWRDVQLTIDNARKEMAAGNKEEAMKLAQKAKMHSELGYEQARSQMGKIQIPTYLQR
ncbi:MAG: hypothetical protein GDA45_03605 [Chromatiales bacterium]|nr:hypothetical protein [Chromatiales bacterium]